VARGAQVGRVEMGGNPYQKVDFQKLLPGTINLPGVFAMILGAFWCKSKGLGWRFGFGPPFGRENCHLQTGTNC